MSKDYQRPLHLDFAILGRAQAYYAKSGFVFTPVPWVVGEEAYNDTRPPEAIPYATLGGYLVGSAEQAFLQLMLNGERLGKAQATTPCFRDEDHDEIHSPYFMKTELIDTVDVSDESLHAMISVAESFFAQYLPVQVLPLEDNTFDIACARTELELGSYGIRQHGELSWVYGTGVALPRLSQAIATSRSADS